MKKFISLFLMSLIFFNLVGCQAMQETEHLYTTHGIYFNIGQNLLITPNGEPYIFATDEKIKFVDGDKIQLNYTEVKESYPMQITAKNIKEFEDDFELDKIIETMKTLDVNFGEIYMTLVGEEVSIKEGKLAKLSNIVDLIDSENKLFSPVSLNFVLALISEGTNEEIRFEFERYFGMSFDKYIELYSSYVSENIEVANAIFLKEGLSFNEEFKNTERLSAELNIEEFNEEFIEKVNQWCAEKTHDMITSILDEVPEVEAIVLSALYFEDEWAEEYIEESIQEGLFNNEIEVNYLNSDEFIYFENEFAIGFAKEYKNNRFSFIGVLPKEEGEFTLASLDLDSLLESKKEIETHVLIPEFEFENMNELTDIVKNIGLESIFNDGALSNIASESLYVEKILQKTKIKVNREGTIAAAVTEALVRETALNEEQEFKTVELNRPFAFMIYDKELDMPLFIGKVVSILE